LCAPDVLISLLFSVCSRPLTILLSASFLPRLPAFVASRSPFVAPRLVSSCAPFHCLHPHSPNVFHPLLCSVVLIGLLVVSMFSDGLLLYSLSLLVFNGSRSTCSNSRFPLAFLSHPCVPSSSFFAPSYLALLMIKIVTVLPVCKLDYCKVGYVVAYGKHSHKEVWLMPTRSSQELHLPSSKYLCIRHFVFLSSATIACSFSHPIDIATHSPRATHLSPFFPCLV